MKTIKTPQEIETMKISGEICAQALKKVLENVRPGIKCTELDKIARREIESRGATSSFMTVDDYKWTICTTINDQVVHGIPGQATLKEGDILGIDIGALYKGFHSDLAISVSVGEVSNEKRDFLEVGRSTLKKAIACAVPGAKVGDISHTIQEGVEKAGYSIVKNLTGHGIGRELHEDPMIPGFGKEGVGPQLKEGMTLAIEVIYAQGTGEVKIEDDNWTISTEDGSLGGLFEQTIAVTNGGPIVLTPYL
ncbi:MAG: type I methionyl aminopeptidase [Candidatus Curtissbacteria bacterium]